MYSASHFTKDLLSQHGLKEGLIRLDDGSHLQVLEVVRLIPQRRWVCRALWKEQAVYAKLFFGKHANRYAQRDQQGILALQTAGIDSPAILADTAVSALKAQVLVIAAIEHGVDAETLYAQSSPKERLSLMQRLIQVLAKQHNAGLLQTDMYLKNFLITSTQVWSIDGDGIRRYDHLPRKQALQNLSMLLSKIDVIELMQCLPEWLKQYTQSRQWSIVPDTQILWRSILAVRIKATHRYADQKVFRQCTDVQVTKHPRYFFAKARSTSLDIPEDTEVLDRWMQNGGMLKNGNTCTVTQVNIAQQPVVIKRYNIKHLGHALSRMWRPSRAAVSWANAHRLLLLGLSTPAPLALLEARCLGLRGKAYYISEYVDAPDLAEFLTHTADKVQRAAVVKAVTQLCYRLYLLQISHGDFKASNIKVLNGKPLLIDLDSMRQHCSTAGALRAHSKDLRRLMQNWKDNTSLYNAFMKSFKVVYDDHTPLIQANVLTD